MCEKGLVLPSSVSIAAQGPELDESVLTRLFDLAGPEQTAEILARLIQDLRGVLQAMERSSDPVLLRRHVHALIGIAGTVGALQLHARALEAKRMLREGPARAPEEALAGLGVLTQRLIDRLSDMRKARAG